MQGILINPEEHTVEVVELEDDIDSIHKLIEAPLFDCVRLEHDDVIYIDDEGLYNKHDFFAIEGFPNPLAGRGLVLGTDSEGGSTDPIHDLTAISNMVKFISFEEALEMAQLVDSIGEKREAELGDIGFIYMPISGILKSARYTDSSS
jgi:hypothetical protein